MESTTPDRIRETVRAAYGAVASRGRHGGCCGNGPPSCCAPAGTSSTRLGYTEADVAAVPDGAGLGLGCGNPVTIAQLRPGERVLDLGSGGGFDAFLAARQGGTTGRVIGVDMTHGMIELARRNAEKVGLDHVEFRLGTIEQLPVDDASVDVIISNCVINLSPDSPPCSARPFASWRRCARLAISDMVAIGDLPGATADGPTAYASCIAGAARVAELERMIADAGFAQIRISVKS